MFPPRAPATDALDLAQLHFMQRLLGYGASLREAGEVIAAELDRLRQTTERSRPLRYPLTRSVLIVDGLSQ